MLPTCDDDVAIVHVREKTSVKKNSHFSSVQNFRKELKSSEIFEGNDKSGRSMPANDLEREEMGALAPKKKKK